MARAVHMDATTPGATLRRALCGWLQVDTETDVTRITCKDCRSRIAGKGKPAKDRARRTPKDVQPDAQLIALLAPKAPAPPRLDPAAWAACCEATRTCGAKHTNGPRPCGCCPKCEWEKLANLWGSKEVAAHNQQHRVAKLPGAARWPSINKALVAYAEYRAHERHAKSATGGILARIERGCDTEGGVSRPDDPMQRAADDIVAVEQALHVAYPEGAHALPQRTRVDLLLVRTPGVLPVKVDAHGDEIAPVMPSYEQLAEHLGATPGDIQALVNTGRERAAWNLFERGMIGRPQEMRRDARGGRRSVVDMEQPEAPA